MCPQVLLRMGGGGTIEEGSASYFGFRPVFIRPTRYLKKDPVEAPSAFISPRQREIDLLRSYEAWRGTAATRDCPAGRPASACLFKPHKVSSAAERPRARVSPARFPFRFVRPALRIAPCVLLLVRLLLPSQYVCLTSLLFYPPPNACCSRPPPSFERRAGAGNHPLSLGRPSFVPPSARAAVSACVSSPIAIILDLSSPRSTRVRKRASLDGSRIDGRTDG